MATVLIHAGVTCGALGAILAGRNVTSPTVADYSTYAAAAGSIADEVVTKCAAITLADADSAYIQDIASSVALGVCEGRLFTSATDADYSTLAAAIAAAIKSAVSFP